MAPRLKVFVTSDGLTDFVVAASSRPKALAAWGTHQDLFKTGLARETDDPYLIAAATARPGEVLRMPAATRADLANLEPPGKPAAKRPPAEVASKLPPKVELKLVPKATPKPKGPSKAALKKIADLEQKLAKLDRTHQAARAKLAKRQAALEREIEAQEAEHGAKRARLEAALSEARRAPGSPPGGSGRSQASDRERR